MSLTDLCAAAYNGDVQKLQELLANPEYKAQVNTPLNSTSNHSALFYACYGAANAETIRELLNAGADPLQCDRDGFMPLHLAANAADPAIIAALLEAPNMYANKLAAATGSGRTPFQTLFVPGSGISATEKSKNANVAECIPYLLKRDEQPLVTLKATDNYGLSALTLIKYTGQQAAFGNYVKPAIFSVLLKPVSVPGNIQDLLAQSAIAYDRSQTFAASLSNSPAVESEEPRRTMRMRK